MSAYVLVYNIWITILAWTDSTITKPTNVPTHSQPVLFWAKWKCLWLQCEKIEKSNWVILFIWGCTNVILFFLSTHATNNCWVLFYFFDRSNCWVLVMRILLLTLVMLTTKCMVYLDHMDLDLDLDLRVSNPNPLSG